MTRRTLQRILEREFTPEDQQLYAEREQLLDVLYYHPGYITAEEFFHRMFVSIHRLRSDKGAAAPGADGVSKPKQDVVVMFNSLDQLSARFPLCAREDIFVPGIIETLSGEGITSIFIAVEEPGQPREQYGLLPMADLILSFHPYRFAFTAYHKHLDEVLQLARETGPNRPRVDRVMAGSSDTTKDVIVLQVVRHAGGHPAGDKGILELVETDDELEKSLYPRKGLHFTQLSGRYGQGTRLMEVY